MSVERKGGGRESGGRIKKKKKPNTHAGDERPIFALSEFQCLFLSSCSLIEFVCRKSGLEWKGSAVLVGSSAARSAPWNVRLRAGASRGFSLAGTNCKF